MFHHKRILLLGSILLLAALCFTFSPLHSGTALAAFSESCPPAQSSGSNNTWVQVIQFDLNADHFEGLISFPNYPLATDGIFGPQTETAVKDYQTGVMKISATGTVAAATWDSLGFCTGSSKGFDLTGSTFSGSHCPGGLSNGSSGIWVQALQHALNVDANDGFISKSYGSDTWWPLVLDGSFGTHTADAVKSLQKANHINQDGIVGNQTWNSMGLCYS